MFRNCYLIDPHGGGRLLREGSAPPALRRALGAVLVIPRSLCLYVRLDAGKVPRWRVRSFVRLQLLTLSPIAGPGMYVARQGAWLHVWLWDRARVDACAVRLGLKPARVEAVPSSVLTPPARDGAIGSRTPGSDGVHLQLWQGARLLHDGWLPGEPSAPQWRAWRTEVARLDGVEWPEDLLPAKHLQQLPARRWAGNLLREATAEQAMHRQRAAALMAKGAVSASMLATAVGGAWVLAQHLALEAQLRQLKAAEAQVQGQLGPIEQARSSALGLQSWVASVDRLRPGPSTRAVLMSIGAALTAHNAVLRDLDIQGAAVRATVVPAAGELNLPELTESLTRTAGFADVRFLDVAPPGGFRFAWQLRERHAGTVSPASAQGASTR